MSGDGKGFERQANSTTLKVESQPRITESFFEHRITLAANGVELTDLSLNKDVTNLGETYLNVLIRRLNAAARVGLNAITFIVANPDWGTAPELVPIFDRIAGIIRGTM